MLELLRNKRILVVVAHPDDEVIGLGGTMYKLINEQNCQIRAVILGEGITSRAEVRDPLKWKSELEIHRRNIQQAVDTIGYESVGIYNFPDNRFDTIPLLDIIKVVEQEKRSFNAETIFTHHGGDVNIDHQKTFEAVITACRPMEGENVKNLITFETMSGTEWRASSDPRHFVPNLFFPVSEEALAAKIKAMEAYEFERRTYPHPRSPEALRIRAQMWGITNGCYLAEAFQIIRLIIPSTYFRE
jgi:LmbE family N-acetylglucosaminyl deacetylase